MSVNFTKSQLDAINAKGVVLVSAAAGSGKTAVLVERIIKRFCDEASPLMADRALIVTFTNAAADELKSKIEASLKAKFDQNPNSELLKRQNLLFKRATVCTIDSFCISLLKDNFNLLDISRDFKINDSTNIDVEIDTLLNKFIFNKFKSGDEVLLRVIDSLKNGYDETYLKRIIKTLYFKSRSMPYPLKWLDELLSKHIEGSQNFINSDWAKFVFKKLTITANKALLLNSKLREFCAKGELINEKHLPSIDNRISFLTNILNACKNLDWDGCISLFSAYKHTILRSNYSKDSIVSNLIKDSNSTIKETLEFIDKTFDANLDNIEYTLTSFYHVLEDVILLIKEFDKEILENSKQNNSYTFDQIEHLALDLLTMDNEIATLNFNSMYDAILVDEYQDTSNLQDELFAVLSKQKQELFMVGDVKQSIYGFRNANPDNFLKKKDEYPLYSGIENPCKVLLTGNFRSRKGICDFINYLFSAYMTKSNADMDYNDEEALVPMSDYPENSESSDVEIKLLENDVNISATEYEANYIADYIIETISKDAFLDDGNGGLRKAEFKDFILLMRSPNKRANTFVKVFNDRGIPINSPSESFKDVAEIKVALAYLNAIENVNNSISLFTVLKSPLYNFSDNEIAEIVSVNKNFSLYNNLQSAAKHNQKVCNFIEQFDKFRTYHAILPLQKLLNMIYSETYMLEIYSSLENGTLKKANLLMLLEISSRFNIEAGKGINELIAFVESDTSNSLAVNVSNSQNAVQIASIHKSKGLQYNICILCSTQTRFNTSDTTSQIVCDDNLGVSFPFYDKKFNSYLTPVSSKFISDGMKAKIYKEELRLLYVALTRAKEKLVVVSTSKNSENYLDKITAYSLKSSKQGFPFDEGSLINADSYSDWIVSAALYHKDGIAFRRGEEDFGCSHYDCKFKFSIDKPDLENIKIVNSQINPDLIDVKDCGYFMGFEYPYKSVNLVPAKTSVTDILKKEISAEVAFKSRPSFISEGGLTAAEKGTATHKFMEYCNFESAAQDMEAEIERLYEWEYISQKEAEAINRESLKTFFKSYVYGIITKAKEVHKEYRFIAKIPAHELNNVIDSNFDEYTLIQGVADCVVINDDGIVIIDYKTDSSTDEAYYKNEYSRQLQMYSNALSQIFKKPVIKRIIYSFKLQKCIEL